ncbi:Fanconi anemia group M protein isoform X2 [Protopterus annectens]|uniref:Fanconi anemia group M protein isoform X2 n=1 Tax=Protopterus annectens TaxID=7888 RepID=UPI001CFAAA46|nr:Fanconi anemia group M protein isoform X2 [Protopterus annectens]
MNGGKQKTLFQSWGASASNVMHKKTSGSKRAVIRKPNNTKTKIKKHEVALKPLSIPSSWGEISTSSGVQSGFEEEEDDDVLLVAVYEAENSLNSNSAGESLLNAATCQQPGASKNNQVVSIENLPGFDISAGDVWIYPTNYSLRQYQFSIAQECLYKNTLVCLPTGLGKTFIAAVVMYNFYRWYPSGKIVFMAPTKPLVAQQIEACYKVMGIPQDHMAEMTGNTLAVNRKEIWAFKRVFFLTPQVMVNDLSRGACPATEVVCVVIDEAHKALGNHAYCQVVKELCNYTQHFRVLALSATPGSDTKAVQQVISNLLIAHIELRSEDSSDIQPYSYQRQVEKFVVPLGDELKIIRNLYLKVLEAFTSRLTRMNVMPRKDVPNMTKYQLILARDQFRKNPPSNIVGAQQGMVEGDFALCISLYHGYELLLQMGVQSLYMFLHGILDGSKGMTRARNELCRCEDFMDLYKQLEAMLSHSSLSSTSESNLFSTFTGPSKKTFVYSHPKLKKLEEVVIQHFQSWAGKQGNTTSEDCSTVSTRVMIFSSFRDSVQEIANMLSQHQPLIRVMTFVGHSSGKSVKGYTQKEQLEVVKRFREGGYNTLVSTCVGEEGLDIGEVDLIICFDAQKSPIRLVQRMGRTGRKRQGRIVILLTEGKEERTYNQSQSSKRSVYKAIMANNSKGVNLCQHSPRMIPIGINPVVHKMFISCGTYETKEVSRSSSKSRKSSSCIFDSGGHPKGQVSKENGFLTSEEFEVWTTKYCLSDDDGVGEPRLPGSDFAVFKDEQNQQHVDPEDSSVCELSLSEWKVWQNRPFPTYVIDHSDRCQHFISIMEMIDLLRQEDEDNCSYDLEMMAFLQREDIENSSNASENKSLHSHKSVPSKQLKSSESKHITERITKTFISESDEEDIALFKPVKPKGKLGYSRLSLEALEIIEGQDDPHTLKCNKTLYTVVPSKDAPFSELHYNNEETQYTEVDQHSDNKDVYNARSVDKEMFMPDNMKSTTGGLLSVRAELNYSTTKTKENTVLKNQEQDAGETLQLNRRSSSYFMKPDSGYNSFNDEAKFDTGSIFYPPVSNGMLHLSTVQSPDLSTNIFSPNIKTVLTHVKEFLAKSPPPFETLTVLDEAELCIKDQSETDLFYNKMPAQNKQKSTDSILEKNVESVSVAQEQKSLIVQVEQLHGLEIRDEKMVLSPNWEDVFDGSEEELEECEQRQAAWKQNLQVSSLHPQTIPKQYFTKDGQCVNLPCEKVDSDQSLDLFENEISFDLDLPNPSECKNVLLDCHGPDMQKSSEEPLQYCEKWSFSENSVVGDKKLAVLVCNEINENSYVQVSNNDEKELPSPSKTEDDYDYSCDLFSVNFDLGFSLTDSGNEPLECDDSMPVEAEPALESSEKQQNCLKLTVSSFSTPVLETKISTGTTTGNNTSPISSVHPSFQNCSLFATFSTPSFSTSAYKSFAFDKNTSESSLKHRNENTPPSAVNSTESQIVRTLAKSTAFHRPCTKDSLRDEKVDNSEVASRCGEVSSSDSEEEIVYRRERRKVKTTLESPEVENYNDFDSPVAAVKKRRQAFNISESSSDDDFHDNVKEISRKDPGVNVIKKKGPKIRKSSRHMKRKKVAQAFFDEEADLSSEDADAVSSDETDDSEDECDTSLVNFLNDDIQPSQGLNDSEMHGIYLKSVQSPAVHGKFKMVYKKKKDLNVFSQISEQDETYMEDSFIVRGGDDEDDYEDCEDEEDALVERIQEDSSDDEVIDLELLSHKSFLGEQRQYCTRRKMKLKLLESEQGLSKKAKCSRIIIPNDSSDEDNKVENQEHCSIGMKQSTQTCKKLQSSSHLKKPDIVTNKSRTMNMSVEQRHQNRLNLKASVSEILDFHHDGSSGIKRPTSQNVKCKLKRQTDYIEPQPEKLYKKCSSHENLFANASSSTTSILTSKIPSNESSCIQSNGSFGIQGKTSPLCVLVDSREISSGPEVASCLRIKYSIKTEIQSLCGCDYIVSNRMAVTRKLVSDFASSMNKNKFTEHIHQLQNMFERICIIVEKDRVKAGETSRIFQRTKYYDSMLSALISAGIKILFSTSQEETAGLLAELVNLEKRKNAAIVVPTEVKGPKQQALQFYLSIPNVSYITALNLCHQFSTVGQMINSSVDKISSCAQVSSHKAEEIYRYIHYAFDSQMLPARCIPGNKKYIL